MTPKKVSPKKRKRENNRKPKAVKKVVSKKKNNRKLPFEEARYYKPKNSFLLSENQLVKKNPVYRYRDFIWHHRRRGTVPRLPTMLLDAAVRRPQRRMAVAERRRRRRHEIEEEFQNNDEANDDVVVLPRPYIPFNMDLRNRVRMAENDDFEPPAHRARRLQVPDSDDDFDL